MFELELSLLLMLGLAAFFAGYVDAVVGGGGLVQIPALLSAFPTTSPATLFGTNKLASIVGTTSAAIQYARRVSIPWGIALPGAVAALVGAWFGARAVAWLPSEIMRPLVLVLLIGVAIYTFVKKDLGAVQGPRRSRNIEIPLAVAIGMVIGFYDGFFGPGTGSFLIFLFVRLLHLDFLHASVTSKIVNVATNFAALSFFALNVEVLWKLGLFMAICNLTGAVVGSRTAIRRGASFVRTMFLAVVSVLVLKIFWDLVSA